MSRILCVLFLVVSLLQDAQAQRRYTFKEGSALGSEWRYIGERQPQNYRILNDRLRLYGDIYELKDGRSFTFAGLPQGSKPFEVTTKLRLTDAENGDEAGLCLYRSKAGFVQCCLSSQNGQRRLKLRLQLLSHRLQLFDKNVGLTSEVYLRIGFDGSQYNFYYSTDDKRYQLMDTVEGSLLETSLVGGADEVLVGMFCFNGNSKFNAGYTFGEFDYFDFDEKE
jgi:beta-xylosidase